MNFGERERERIGPQVTECETKKARERKSHRNEVEKKRYLDPVKEGSFFHHPNILFKSRARDSTTRFVGPSACRSIGPSVRHTLLFYYTLRYF